MTAAAVLHAVDQPLVVDDIELRPLGPGEVRVRIAASGVCHSDVSIQDGTLPALFPAVLGHEGAGVAEEVAPDVTSVRPGDHVVLSWMAPCRRCAFCLAGEAHLCAHGFDHGFTPHGTLGGDAVYPALGTGTFAEATIVPAAAAIPVDPACPLDVAALVGCGVTTGMGAVLNAARVEPGSTVAVVGCGGVGLAAVQAARLAGAARIVAVDVVAAKLAMAVDNGATDTVAASDTDPVAAVRDLTGGLGVDYAFEVVGRSSTIRQAYDMARRGGTAVVVGAGAADDLVSIGAMSLMSDGKTTIGCIYGSADPARDFPKLVALHQAGRIDLGKLVTRRIPLDGVNDAFAAMQTGEVARSVIVF